jgi:hypothetical protein
VSGETSEKVREEVRVVREEARVRNVSFFPFSVSFSFSFSRF